MNTVQVTLPETVTVAVKKAGKNFSVSPASLSAHIIAAIFANGLGQKLGDSASSVSFKVPVDPQDPKGPKVMLKGKDLAQAKAKALEAIDECFANIQKGIWAKTRSASGDPVENRMRTLAIKTIGRGAEFKAWLAENGFKAVAEEATTELGTRAAAMVTANPSFGKAGTLRDIAERQLADEAMLAESDDDDNEVSEAA